MIFLDKVFPLIFADNVWVCEEELKWEGDTWSFYNIRKFALALFYK